MAEGDIGTVQDDEEFDGTEAAFPNIIHISGSVYAIAYQGPGNDGWIKTVTITDAGVIAMVGGGSLEFDDVNGEEPRILHISGSVYAIAYTAAGIDGWIKTVTISDAGAIALVGGGSLEFEADTCYFPDFIHVTGNVYAIAYTSAGLLGQIKTVTISDAGAIALVGGGSLEFDATRCYQPNIIHVAGDVYAIAYQGDPDDGWIKTVTISDAGALALVGGGSLEFDDAYCMTPDIIHVSGNVYAISYKGPDMDGWIKTVTISDAGALALVGGGSLEFDADMAAYPMLRKISGDKYVIVYTDSATDGWIRGLTISDAGALSLTALNSLEFDNDRGNQPDIIHIAGSIYAIAYSGTDGDGWIKTVEIETVIGGAIQCLMMMGIG